MDHEMKAQLTVTYKKNLEIRLIAAFALLKTIQVQRHITYLRIDCDCRHVCSPEATIGNRQGSILFCNRKLQSYCVIAFFKCLKHFLNLHVFSIQMLRKTKFTSP